jgi:hypothetical protein
VIIAAKREESWLDYSSNAVTNEGSGLDRHITADQQGNFVFPLLPPGTYTLTAEAPGFSRLRLGGLQLDAGTNLRVPVRLPPATSIRGRVTDLQTGEPIAKALVAIRSQQLRAITGDDGEFEVHDVLPGRVDLYVSTVGYGLLKQSLELRAGVENKFDLTLGQEALKHTETVVVNAGPFAHFQAEAPVEQSITSTELKNLSSVMLDDPIRAVQAMPGVAANNDFYANFAVRGSGPSEIGIFVDGALMTMPFHGILDDRGNAASISLLDSVFVDSMALLSGNAPAQYGSLTGSILDVQTREGDVDRATYRADVSLVAASTSAEGPLGASRKATYLASARKDYVSLIVGRNSGLGLSFYDMYGDLTYKPSADNSISINGIYGETGVSLSTSSVFGIDELKDGNSRSALASVRWKWSNAATLSQAQIYSSPDSERDGDLALDLLEHSRGDEIGYREDVTRQIGTWNTLQAGGIFRRLDRDYLKNEPWNYATEQFSDTLILSALFSRAVSQSGAYIQDTASVFDKRLVATLGGRWDHFSQRGVDTFLPRASLSGSPLRNTKLTAAAGQYTRFCQGRSKSRPLGRSKREPVEGCEGVFRGRRGAGA